MNAPMAIAVTEAKMAVEMVPDASLSDRFRAAAKVTHNHWILTDPDKQFFAACEALYAFSSESEQERIVSELKGLRDLAALMNGVPVDIERLVEQMEEAPERIGLRDLWDEVTG